MYGCLCVPRTGMLPIEEALPLAVISPYANEGLIVITKNPVTAARMATSIFYTKPLFYIFIQHLAHWVLRNDGYVAGR